MPCSLNRIFSGKMFQVSRSKIGTTFSTIHLKHGQIMIIIDKKSGEAMKKQFEEWEATELFCPKCGRAQPVRKRLLLLLPDGDKYDYVCAVCGEPVGGKMDEKRDNFRFLVR
jgi:hypothetical protein